MQMAGPGMLRELKSSTHNPLDLQGFHAIVESLSFHCRAAQMHTMRSYNSTRAYLQNRPKLPPQPPRIGETTCKLIREGPHASP